MATIQTMSSKVQLAYGGVTIPSYMLGEVSLEGDPIVRTRDTLAGSRETPTGTYENVRVNATIYAGSPDDIKAIFPGIYNAPTAPQMTGNIIIGSDSCTTTEGNKLNIHDECSATDNSDWYFGNAAPVLDLSSLKFSSGETPSVSVQWLINEDENGNVLRWGTGNLTALSHFDPVTQTTVANA